ncbi:MAG: hypothetical protein ACYC6C_11420, partial [Coriobacteriia bacterium]
MNTSTASNIEPLYTTVKYICFTGYGPNDAQKAHPRGRLQAADLATHLMVGRGVVMASTNLADVTGFAHCDGGAWANGTPNGHGATRPNLLA